MSTPGQPTLAQQLSQPIKSVKHLLSSLLAQLDKLDLVLASEQPLLRCYLPTPTSSTAAPTAGPSDTTRSNQQWLKRQLGLVQRAIIVSVYPDWAEAVRAEGGDELVELALGRWFGPPTITNQLEYSGQVALSGYSVISSLLSNRRPLALLPSSSNATDPAHPTAAPPPAALHPHSLTFTLQLLSQLSIRFSLPEIWAEVYGDAEPGGGDETEALSGEADSDDSSDEEDHEAGMRNEAWEAAMKGVFGLATRVANACGIAKLDPPIGLEYK